MSASILGTALGTATSVLGPPASTSVSLQPGMPGLSAILYGLPEKQITTHYKMKLAF